jgi:ABC-type oligopeptide transport system substrate-binding subunit
MAFDFDWMNTALFHGKAKRVDSLFSNSPLQGDFVFDNTSDKRSALKKASRMLDDAGWPLQNGQRFDLSLILNNPTEEKIALAYARDLKRLGITLNIRTLDTAQFFGALNDYDYDMISWRWINSLSPGTEQNVYWGCDAADTKGSRNYSGVCDPDIDNIVEKLADAQDYDTLTRLANTLDSMIMDRHLFIPLYYTGVDYVARWPHIQHPQKQSLYGMVLETWWWEK